MMRFAVNVICTAIAVWAATLIDGIDVTGHSTAENALTILVVAVIFGVVNAVLKPLIHTVGCLFYVLTLGLFALVVNGLLFLLTGWIAGKLGLPFVVDGFWAGLWGAIVVAVVSFVLGLIFRPSEDD
ncbi:MAG: putative rane protein [Cryptosporangiaceae bacterium]|jgi:putative membrane protein|nr:putative rane protein [Cryptosporangiaceae bacterium]